MEENTSFLKLHGGTKKINFIGMTTCQQSLKVPTVIPILLKLGKPNGTKTVFTIAMAEGQHLYNPIVCHGT